MSEWFLVSDQTPPNGMDRILICLSDRARKKTWFSDEGLVHEGLYGASGFVITSMHRLCEPGDVIAWRPLPEPYEKEDE